MTKDLRYIERYIVGTVIETDGKLSSLESALKDMGFETNLKPGIDPSLVEVYKKSFFGDKRYDIAFPGNNGVKDLEDLNLFCVVIGENIQYTNVPEGGIAENYIGSWDIPDFSRRLKNTKRRLKKDIKNPKLIYVKG